MSQPTVSIVICVYTLDRWGDILEAIASAQRQTLPPLETIVVVDHNPELRDRLAERFHDVTIVENQFTRGLSGGRNTGISVSRGEIVAFLDDDAVADSAWIETMIPHFDDPGVIGVGSRSLPMWLGERPSWFPDEFLWVVGCSYLGMPKVAARVRNCLGGAMCFRRSLFESISGFNPSLGRGKGALLLSGEETELCLRATSLVDGAKFIYEPASFIAHKVSPKRLNWRYFIRRCYAEGVSKAYLAKLRPSRESLAPERRHALNVLPRGVLKGIRDAVLDRDFGGLARAAGIVVGLGSAAAGYFISNTHMLVSGARTRLAYTGKDTLIGDNKSAEGTSPLPAPKSGLKVKLEAINERFGMHSELLSNAGAIAIGTIGASVLGFVYWWVAARNFTPEAVGLAAAAISMMTLIGMIGELGLGTLLMGEVLLNRRDAPGLVAASLITALLMSLALGVVFILVAPLIISNFNIEFPSFNKDALFVVGCAVMSFAMVLDQALIGWLRAIQQMGRNMLFAALKLAMLVAVAIGGLATVSGQEVAILATWVFGQLTATLLFAGWLVTRGQQVWHKPEFGQLQGRVGKVLSHHFLNTVTQAPVLILPALVTFVMSPRTNAAFYAAFTLINVACYIPAALATVLFTIGSTDPASFSQRLKFSLKLSALIGVATAAGFYVLSQFILGIFSPEYPEIAGTSLALMGAVVLPAAIKYHFITIKRLTNRMTSGAVVLAVAGAFEVGMAFVGAQWYGLWGFTVGWVVASYIEAILMLPAIAKHLSSGAKLIAQPVTAV